MLVVTSHVKAEKKNSPLAHRNHGKPKSYVALLGKGERDSITRQFIKRDKSSNETLYHFRVQPKPGDIYEIRRWYWDAGRETFLGGTVYLGFDAHGAAVSLTRDEAMLSVIHPNIEQEKSQQPAIVYPERILPLGIQVQ